MIHGVRLSEKVDGPHVFVDGVQLERGCWAHDEIVAAYAEFHHAKGRATYAAATIREARRANRLAEAVTTWSSVLDGHTCEPCRARHGQPTGKGVTRHPFPPHPDCENPDGCRCTAEGGVD